MFARRLFPSCAPLKHPYKRKDRMSSDKYEENVQNVVFLKT